jgi:lipoprotein-releasing system permease protein
VINIISAISIAGVSVMTMALIVVLSIFNGFDDLLKNLFYSFDPDLRIESVHGKTFENDSSFFRILENQHEIAEYSSVIEENALLRYEEQQFIARLKGVDENYIRVSGVDTMITRGEFSLWDQNVPLAVFGQGVAYKLSLNVNRHTPIKSFVPKRKANITGSFLDATHALNQENFFVAGIFSIQQDFDNQYVFIPISLARELFDYHNELTAVEIKLDENVDVKRVKTQLSQLLGDEYIVKDRYDQHEFFYQVMKSEKWAVFLILSFILLIASFNVIGSLTMLIIDKKSDILTLRSLGMGNHQISRIFLLEGWLITVVGAVIGLALGALVCYLQMEFGLIRLNQSGSFIIDAYPVTMKSIDFLAIFFTVVIIGLFAAWYPVRYITKKYL